MPASLTHLERARVRLCAFSSAMMFSLTAVSVLSMTLLLLLADDVPDLVENTNFEDASKE